MFLADAWLLWILVPLLALWTAAHTALFLVRRSQRGGASSALRFSSIRILQQLKPSLTIRMRRVVMGLRVLTLALLALAMARPQTGRRQTEISTEGVEIVLVIDTSESMTALDLDANKPLHKRRNRLEVVKAVVDRFVKKRERDRIGMVVFGSEAFTQCPGTLDHGIVATFLDRVEIGMAGPSTALGEAIGVAVKRLRRSDAKSKVVVLLTDGRQTAGSITAVKAAEVAKTFGVKVYAIGAGKRGDAPFIVQDPFGRPRVLYRPQEIDEDTLKKVAETTQGAYFRAEDAAALEEVYARIDALERTEIKTHAYMDYDERFAWFVVPALVLLLLEVVLLGTRLRKIP